MRGTTGFSDRPALKVQRSRSAAPIHCFLTLSPSPGDDSHHPLSRQITLDLGTLKTINDLISHDCPKSKFPIPITILQSGIILQGNDHLS
jgi:hypothetical protein